MKRSSDDVYMSSQLKHPMTSSRGEPSREHEVMSDGAGRQNLTTNIASAYIEAETEVSTYFKAVKDVFQDKKEKYHDFLEVMTDFQSKRFGRGFLLERMDELFKGHRDLILGFDIFLTKGYREQHAEAINFLRKIESRFQGDDRVYKSFLNILDMWIKETKTIRFIMRSVLSMPMLSCCCQACALFQGHEDLLEELIHYFPDTLVAASTHDASARNSVLRDRSSAMPTMRPMHVEKRERTMASHGDRDLSVDHPDLELDGGLMGADKGQRRRVGKEKDCQEETDRSERERDYRDYDYDGTEDRLSHKEKSGCWAEDSGAKPLLDADETFGLHLISPACEDRSSLKSMHCQVVAFLEKVKEKLRSPEDYREFFKCLHIYSGEIITRQELQSLEKKPFA